MTTETTVEVDGAHVRVSNPDKVMFPRQGWTKLDLVHHYVAVAEGALRGVARRPCILKRFNHGVDAKPVFQKRAPKAADHDYVTISFPSGRTADFLVPRERSDVVWMAQLNCVDLNPWPVRADDVDHPDELRVDLDPTPDTSFADVRRVALTCRDVLAEHGLHGWPKTSGSRGVHVDVRIEPVWTATQVRHAALALAREVERRVPELATSAWWKDQRHGVFVDYNQNARDRTVASAYSVRPTGLVSAPLRWDEVADADPRDFPMAGYAADRYREVGDLTDGIDADAYRLDGLLGLYAEQERQAPGGDRSHLDRSR